ncbi:hypothetical protein JCM10207_007127 [Rhodosporidiobolus poonsookiae]
MSRRPEGKRTDNDTPPMPQTHRRQGSHLEGPDRSAFPPPPGYVPRDDGIGEWVPETHAHARRRSSDLFGDSERPTITESRRSSGVFGETGTPNIVERQHRDPDRAATSRDSYAGLPDPQLGRQFEPYKGPGIFGITNRTDRRGKYNTTKPLPPMTPQEEAEEAERRRKAHRRNKSSFSRVKDKIFRKDGPSESHALGKAGRQGVSAYEPMARWL